MARRKGKAKRRRSKKYFNLYDFAVAYGNLSIITHGALGTSPWSAVSGQYDIGGAGMGAGRPSLAQLEIAGATGVSLADMVNDPQLSFDTITSNVRTNAMPMLLSSITFNVGASVFKKIMRKPFTQANKLIAPLGLNVRIG